MGQSFRDGPWKESLKLRRIIRRHFLINGASRVRDLPSEEFCRHGFVLGRSSEAGFGNEMYKILNAAALSMMLKRSLIICQTRGKYPFGDYITYSNQTFTMDEVQNLWRQNGCVEKYGRQLVVRIDEFLKPAKTNVLCSNWRNWEQPIIWFQNTTDATASQFFLKNVHPEMRSAAAELFGPSEQLHSRPNVFGELMSFLISPSPEVKEAVDMVLAGGPDPDISLHMRMLMNRPVRAVQAALNCVRKAMHNLPNQRKRRLVLVSDTPSVLQSLIDDISRFAEVVHFDYEKFQGNMPSIDHDDDQNMSLRVKDWGPAPRWVAFVDFFLAARAKHAVVSGAHRRVGTTYAQLIAAFAAANQLGENRAHPSFSFMSSFQRTLLSHGLSHQIGWGHAWNRFGGPLSCRNQTNHQCAFTPLSPPAWWDGPWQSPIARDVRRLSMYGVGLSGSGAVDEDGLVSFCGSRKPTVRTLLLVQ
ncbi:unnamed protein product [Linum tenue]|uniref:Uncharacterized protein n=1 Tax=Linum tenue TaxID=586396 RepID=A0AAV0HVY5_9ROSI|nr:unnamed protein product [Linum tenue]CAI0389425.1 unnamed protein product [Linum tenue]